MVRPIVVGVHPARHEREPVELAAMLSCMTDAELEVVATFWFDPTPARTARKDFEGKLAQETQEALEDRFADTGRACSAVRVTVAPGSAARLLHETAERVDAGLIVVGSSHRAPMGLMTLGSTTDRVRDRAPCPVAVAPRGFTDPRRAPERIGVAFVDTPEGRAALRGGATMARHTGASLVAYTAIESSSPVATEERAAALDRAIREYAADIDAERQVLDGISGLIAESQELAFLLTGSRGSGPLKATVLGGVSRKLARHAACPLIVVPRGIEDPMSDLFAAPPDKPAAEDAFSASPEARPARKSPR